MRQLFKIVGLTGDKEPHAKILHISFGLVLDMSTRRGTVRFLDDVLRDVDEKQAWPYIMRLGLCLAMACDSLDLPR
jgi:arginyl-tRNA synthetase